VIPLELVLLLALLQFGLGLLGLLAQRSGMVMVVAGVVMLNGILLVIAAASQERAAAATGLGVGVVALMLAIGLIGSAVLYAFHRFSRPVSVDEHDQLKH
jgi:NADH:ubiquinone oxidoreductase subunit K